MSQPKKLVRAEEAQVMLLDKMLQEIRRVSDQSNKTADRLLEVKEIMQEEQAFGAVEAIEKFTVTSHRNHITRIKPWMSVTLVNDGPNSVFVIVNTDKSFDEHETQKGETYIIDMHRPVITDVLLWCRTGESASVRMVGIR